MERVADTDVLRYDGMRVVVWSPRAMPDWRVGTHRKTAVIVHDLRYAVVAAEPADGGWRYVLEPWRGGPHEHPSTTIAYDEEYVAAREEAHREAETRRKQRWAMLPLYFALGFLPRAVKARLHEHHGFEPKEMTRWSVRVELVAILVETILALVSATTGVPFGGGPAVAALFLFAVLPDALVRSGTLLEDDFAAYGFYEWVFEAWKRKP